MNGAIYVSDSGNSKITGGKKSDATYTSIASTCPTTCKLKGNGCYAELSFIAIQTARLNKEAGGLTALQVARAEAKAIDNSYNGGPVPEGRDLRIHVAGDSRTITGTRIIDNAVGRWKKRGGGDCWAYTHAWKSVPKSEWKHVSMLASVDSVNQVAAVREQGYAPAIVVPEFTNSKAFKIEGCDTKWIPCPAQTQPGNRKIGCVDCRLCFDADRLHKGNFGIAFEAHGVKKNTIKRRLNVVK